FTMSTNAGLPSSLRHRIAQVAFRVRLVRAVWGLSLLVLALGLSAAGLMMLDYLRPLSSVVRQTTLTAWVGLGVAAALFGLLLPRRRRLDPEALAAVIEQKSPDLAERLTSSVELAGSASAGNGSRALIDLLIRETDAQASRLNFLPAIRSRSAWVGG